MTVRFADILAADSRIRPHARITPLVEDPDLNARLGGRLLVKVESLQVRGAFKMRGAANAMLAQEAAVRERGVVAFSSGNHAQAVAYMARVMGVSATVVAPSDAPARKLERVTADGARLVTYDRVKESREAIGARIAEEAGAILVKPFDEPLVIAGQGTAGLEAVRQARAMDAEIDTFVVCASGGGLAAGIALAATTLNPGCTIVCAEPEGHADIGASLASGQIVANEPGIRSIQDALLTQSPGELTFPILKAAGARAVAVSDGQALEAMAVAYARLSLVLEPGGAAALAAVLSGQVDITGRTVCVTASGGNVDPEIFSRALTLVGRGFA